MNLAHDINLIEAFSRSQAGCFAKSDLQTALGEKHPFELTRRIRRLEENGALRRFMRGWYVTKVFDLATLSQRIAPSSYVSADTILAEALLVGVRPERSLTAVKVGRGRVYQGTDATLVHLGVKPELFFGFRTEGVVRKASPEKAVLDTLYFHLRGRRYPFDIYSDVRYEQLDKKILAQYLSRYRNPKFVAFARGILSL